MGGALVGIDGAFFVNSTAAMRIARHVLRCNGASPWPRFSDDPLEQFLVEEAVLLRLDEDERGARERAAERQRLEEARAKADEEARARLDAYKATRARAQAGGG